MFRMRWLSPSANCYRSSALLPTAFVRFATPPLRSHDAVARLRTYLVGQAFLGSWTDAGANGPGVRDQPASSGVAARRPGAAQSANSDGYAECMAMWAPDGARMSREAWSNTCNQAKLSPRSTAQRASIGSRLYAGIRQTTYRRTAARLASSASPQQESLFAPLVNAHSIPSDGKVL
jgi:hypothetical protein